MRRFDRTFITGCDSRQEWMIEWFLKNYRKHNQDPIVFADFGISSNMKKTVQRLFDDVIEISDHRVNYANQPRWFLKPITVRDIDALKKVWVDIDCEIVGNVTGIFDRLEYDKISMVLDRPWTSRRKSEWYNSGVFGVIGNPKILHDWINECRLEKELGDQEALHAFLSRNPMSSRIYINELPNKYNFLRLQFLDNDICDEKLIVHWTGYKGKEKIKEKL